RTIEPVLQPLVGRFAPATAHAIAISVGFTIITALHIVLGELAPKGIALQRPEGTARRRRSAARGSAGARRAHPARRGAARPALPRSVIDTSNASNSSGA